MALKFNSKQFTDNLEKNILQKTKQVIIDKITAKFPEVEELIVEYSQSEQKFKVTGKGLSIEQINEVLKDT